MPTYTVQQASHKMDRPDGGYGPMQIIALTLSNGSGEPQQAEWYTKKTTPIPSPGTELEGTLEPGKYGAQWDFKRARNQNGFGGGKGRSPEEGARIIRQHSQEMALRYAAIKGHDAVRLDDDFRKVIDWFAADAKAAKP